MTGLFPTPDRMHAAKELWFAAMPKECPSPDDFEFLLWLDSFPAEMVEFAILRTSKKMRMNLRDGVPLIPKVVLHQRSQQSDEGSCITGAAMTETTIKSLHLGVVRYSVVVRNHSALRGVVRVNFYVVEVPTEVKCCDSMGGFVVRSRKPFAAFQSSSAHVSLLSCSQFREQHRSGSIDARLVIAITSLRLHRRFLPGSRIES
jgi:hypothetical protein